METARDEGQTGKLGMSKLVGVNLPAGGFAEVGEVVFQVSLGKSCDELVGSIQ